MLGPYLFLLYVNDIVDNLESNIRLFADDTSIFTVIDNNDSLNVLTEDLHNIALWYDLDPRLVHYSKSIKIDDLFTVKKLPECSNKWAQMVHYRHPKQNMTFSRKKTNNGTINLMTIKLVTKTYRINFNKECLDFYDLLLWAYWELTMLHD